MGPSTKICSDCKEEKSVEHFSWQKARKRYLSPCKPCMVKRTTASRLKHYEAHQEREKRYNLKHKNLVNDWKSQGCRKCGEDRYWVIDAHHIDPATKLFEVSKARRGIEITKKELKKCIPLCSNCHREFHYFEKKTGISIEEYVHSQH